jgi:hypothetical protein
MNEVFLKFLVLDADNKIMEKKKEITAYQINNVLRVYGEQLRRGKISNRHKDTDTNEPDKISISGKARRESIANDIISNIIERITQSEHTDNVENTVSNALESEHEKSLLNNDVQHNEFIFKKIEGNGETINSISIEDSKFLTNKLKVKKKIK